MPGLLALPWYGAGDEPCDEPICIRGTCAMAQKVVQNAGRAFWDCYELPKQQARMQKGGARSQQQQADKDDKGESERERAFREKREKRQRESRGKDGGLLKISEALKGKDLYALLEVEACASAEDVKKSYRKLVLVHHPDKMTNPTEEQKKHFLLIQEAFEIISDPEKRRRYESMLDFDDSIPTNFGKLAYADFFEVFGPVFKRNARWSARPRVPDLGDENTDIEIVKQFYEFWRNFESWRDPLAMAEKEEIELYCLEEAECREERRWMERENAKVAKKLAQCERDRIDNLVKNAEKHDPRMIAHREQVRAQKEEEKARRAAAAQEEKDRREAAARAAAEEEEARRRVEEERRAEERKRNEEQKNARKAARQRLRALHRGADIAVRRAVHVDQLQQVCLSLETEELNALCAELEALLQKASDDPDAVVEMMHREILKCGATPISDPSVDQEAACKGGNSSASTVSPDASNEDEVSDEEQSPAKTVREPTPEELEAERLRREQEAEEERIRQEKKAEEQRKKREQQRKEDEKRQAALRKMEKKEREAQAKAKAKEAQKLEQEQRQAEEQKQKQQQQREEQRLAAQREEAERQRLHQEELVARAFEADRIARCSVLDAYDEGLLDMALRSTLLREGEEQPNTQLRLALRHLASGLPPPGTAKADAVGQAKKDLEELYVDLALACLAEEGGAGASPEEARARLAKAVAIAVRPPTQGTPELTKETKATVKKLRLRVRGATLTLLRRLAAEEPLATAAAPTTTTQPALSPGSNEAIGEDTQLVATEEGPIFESASSYKTVGAVFPGTPLIAAGAPVEVDGYSMVPLKPRGTVELRLVRPAAPPPPPAGKQSKAGRAVKGAAAKAAKAAASAVPAATQAPAEPEVEGRLRDLIRLAAAGVAGLGEAESDLREAFLGGFDSATALAAGQAPPANEAANPASQEPAAPKEQAAPAKSGKKGGSKEQDKGREEDLDALLQEFGMEQQTPSSKSGKKKGKK